MDVGELGCCAWWETCYSGDKRLLNVCLQSGCLRSAVVLGSSNPSSSVPWHHLSNYKQFTTRHKKDRKQLAFFCLAALLLEVVTGLGA